MMCSLKSQQVTLGIKDLMVNNVAQASNEPVKMYTNPSVNVKFLVTMSKPSSYTIGDGLLYIKLYKSNGQSSDLISPINVPASVFSSSAASSINVDINDDYITFENGNYILATLVSNQYGPLSSAPPIPINKVPNFGMNPRNIIIPCGSTNPIIFTATSNTNVGNFVYRWNVGTGWSKDGNPVAGTLVTSTNTIILSPTNPSVLPSPISLTIDWNNNYSYGIGTTIGRPYLDSSNSLQITGNTATVCTFPTTVSYSINAEAGNSVSWTSSDSSIGELVNTNGITTDIILKKQGEVTLSAIVSNQCGQTKTVTKKFWAGAPLVYMPNAYCGNPYDSVCFNSNYNVQTGQYSNVVVDALGFDGTPNLDTDFEWEKINGPFTFASYGNGYYSNVSNNGNKVTGRMAILYITGGYNYMQVRARAKNSCGWGPWKNILFQSGGSKMALDMKEYRVSPNPATDFINITLFDENSSSDKNLNKVYAELYSVTGIKVGKTDVINNKGRISVSGLNKGVYTLKIYSGQKQEDHYVIIK